MSFELKRWLQCPECGEDERVGCGAYRGSFTMNCYECGHEAEVEIGDRPLHKLRLSEIEEQVSR